MAPVTPGTVDPRNIKEVTPDDINGYERCHFFAGVAGWDLALQLAGWPNSTPVWTGSCPCQPYSLAGKRLGDKDPRNLWPEFCRLIRECHPPVVLGEQVASAVGQGWLDRVFADLERENYACGAAVLGAHSIGAPHIRQRLFWVAHAPGSRLFRTKRADKAGIAPGVLGAGFESGCRDFHGRRISAEPGAFPLAARIPAELGSGEPALLRMARCARANQAKRLAAYGNSIVPEVAARFIRAVIDACDNIGDQVMADSNGVLHETNGPQHLLPGEPAESQPPSGDGAERCSESEHGTDGSRMKSQTQEAAPDLVQPSADTAPDDTWPTEFLLSFAMTALSEGDRHERRLHALARKSVVERFRAGHAFSILQERLTATGEWCEFQDRNQLPRTKVWEAITVYRKAVELGHGEGDVAGYGTWTELMVAYGVVRPRKAQPEGHGVAVTELGDDGGGENTVEGDGVPEDDRQAEEDDREHDEPEFEPDEDVLDGDLDAWTDTSAEEGPPIATDAELEAASAFVDRVGGLPNAVRVLATKGVMTGDKDVLKDALKEMCRAAQGILSLAEINEIVICLNVTRKGFKVIVP